MLLIHLRNIRIGAGDPTSIARAGKSCCPTRRRQPASQADQPTAGTGKRPDSGPAPPGSQPLAPDESDNPFTDTATQFPLFQDCH